MRAYPHPTASKEPVIPRCSHFTKNNVAARFIKGLPTESSVNTTDRFSARSQADPGIVRFWHRITRVATLNRLLKAGLVNRRMDSCGAATRPRISVGIDVRQRMMMDVEQTAK